MAEVFRGVAESIAGLQEAGRDQARPAAPDQEQEVRRDVPRRGAAVAVPPAREHRPGLRHLERRDDTYFIVMEFVDGCNLKALIERQKQRGKRMRASRTTIYIIIECCKGLNYAHDLEHPETGEPLAHRPPRHLAAQHPDLEERRGEDRRLRARQGQQPARVDRPRRGEGQVQLPVARGGERPARSTRAPTSSRSASSCGRCSPAGACSSATPTTRPSSWCGRRGSRRSRRSTPRSSPSSSRSSARRWPAIPTSATSDAADLGDALAQYLFSRRMKVTARDIATLVRDTQLEAMRKRSSRAQGVRSSTR